VRPYHLNRSSFNRIDYDVVLKCLKHSPWSSGGGRFFEGGGQANAENRQRLKCQNNPVGILKGREQSRRNIKSNPSDSWGIDIFGEKHPQCRNVSQHCHSRQGHERSSQHICPKQAHPKNGTTTYSPRRTSTNCASQAEQSSSTCGEEIIRYASMIFHIVMISFLPSATHPIPSHGAHHLVIFDKPAYASAYSTPQEQRPDLSLGAQRHANIIKCMPYARRRPPGRY
jgi:hypothetical protein